MLIITSPAKTLDESSKLPNYVFSKPQFQAKTNAIVTFLKGKNPQELAQILGVSDTIANLNFDRFQNFDKAPDRPCLFTYKGDVFRQLQLESYHNKHLEYAQKHLHIITGMYGILRALDVICPYRLEMANKLASFEVSDLVEYWQKDVVDYLNTTKHKSILNLASNEYAKILDTKDLKTPVINVHFHVHKDGKYKTVGILAKRARGLMIDWLIQNFVTDIEEVKRFDCGGWRLYSESDDFFIFRNVVS